MGAMSPAGTQLLQARESVRISLRELAAECGVDKDTLCRIESGRRPATTSEAHAIWEALARINTRRQDRFRELVQPAATNCIKTS